MSKLEFLEQLNLNSFARVHLDLTDAASPPLETQFCISK